MDRCRGAAGVAAGLIEVNLGRPHVGHRPEKLHARWARTGQTGAHEVGAIGLGMSALTDSTSDPLVPIGRVLPGIQLDQAAAKDDMTRCPLRAGIAAGVTGEDRPT